MCISNNYVLKPRGYFTLLRFYNLKWLFTTLRRQLFLWWWSESNNSTALLAETIYLEIRNINKQISWGWNIQLTYTKYIEKKKNFCLWKEPSANTTSQVIKQTIQYYTWIIATFEILNVQCICLHYEKLYSNISSSKLGCMSGVFHMHVSHNWKTTLSLE